MTRSKKGHTASSSGNASAVKGKLVEIIVAGMHNAPDVTVEQNVRVPSLRNFKRKREIDVLVSAWLAGYPVRLAIECENYQSVIDAPKIDAYIGKLQDIGIPTQHGIYVTNGASTTSRCKTPLKALES